MSLQDDDFALIKLLRNDPYLTEKEFYSAIAEIVSICLITAFLILALTGSL